MKDSMAAHLSSPDSRADTSSAGSLAPQAAPAEALSDRPKAKSVSVTPSELPADQMPCAMEDTPPSAEDLTRLEGRQALIVDDDPAFLAFLDTLLTRRGVITTQAVDGVQALEILQGKTFDFILSDVQMPRMNGFDLLVAVRGSESYDLTPFILLTGKPAFAGIQSGVSRGADGYLPKPFSEAALLNTILGCLGRVKRITEQASSELDQLRGNLLSMLPHELNTPLNGIFGVADLLEMGAANDAELADCAQILRISAERMLRLTTNFVLCAELRLHDSLPDQTSLLYEEESRSTTEEIEAAALNRARSYERQEDLQLKMARATLPISTPAILKIVDELLDNAFKFSHPGDAVILRGAIAEGRYTCSLEDHGRSGTTPAEFARRGLFVQFNRQFLEQQGTGLGLYLVERLLSLHAGTLEFLPTSGGGITVHFSLPLESSATEVHPTPSSAS